MAFEEMGSRGKAQSLQSGAALVDGSKVIKQNLSQQRPLPKG